MRLDFLELPRDLFSDFFWRVFDVSLCVSFDNPQPEAFYLVKCGVVAAKGPCGFDRVVDCASVDELLDRLLGFGATNYFQQAMSKFRSKPAFARAGTSLAYPA